MDRKVKQANKMLKLLKATGGKFDLLSESQRGSVVRRFIDSFIEAEKRESIHLNLARAENKQKPIDYHRYFPKYCKRDAAEVLKYRSLLGWLSCDRKRDCYLIFSEPWIEPLRIDTSSFKDINLHLFPDSYWIDFATNRVAVITRDGDTIFCEL